jgi:hypothetical protein
MLGVAAYSAARLVAAGVRRRDTEIDADWLHVIMGIAMAGTLPCRRT